VLLPGDGEDLVIAIQGRRGVPAEDAFVHPAAKLARRVPILLLRAPLGKVDADDVVRTLGRERRTLGFGHDVVGRRHQRIEGPALAGS